MRRVGVCVGCCSIIFLDSLGSFLVHVLVSCYQPPSLQKNKNRFLVETETVETSDKNLENEKGPEKSAISMRILHDSANNND
jgi:hypothetical protein